MINEIEFNYLKNKGIIDYLKDTIINKYNNIAILSDDKTITYGELYEKCTPIINYINSLELSNETNIGLLLKDNFLELIFQVAIVLSRCTHVHLVYDYSNERLQDLIHSLQIDIVITSKEYEKRNISASLHFIEDIQTEKFNKNIPLSDITSSPEQRTHVLFTSGTTGIPKAIPYYSYKIINTIMDNHFNDINEWDRIAFISEFSFDASLFNT